MAATTNKLDLVRESGTGKLYHTGDELIQVLQVQGSWREMGHQYGAFVARGPISHRYPHKESIAMERAQSRAIVSARRAVCGFCGDRFLE